MKNALRNIKNSGVEYDYIMLTRSDMFMKYHFPYEELLNVDKDTLYGISDIYTNDKDQLYVYDVWFFGQYNTISKLIRNMPFDLNGMHTGLSVLIQDCGLKVKGLGGKMDCVTIRPNCRELKDEELLVQNLQNKQLEWGSNYFYP